MPPLANPASSSTASITTTSRDTLPIHLPPSIRLVLRAEPAEERHIQWAEDVIDNEGMGKKSSKVCCIYHRPHSVDESSDSSDSSSSSSSNEDSDSGDNDERAQSIGGGSSQPRRSRARRNQRHHDHNHDNDNDKDKNKDGHVHGDGESKSKTRRRPSPNAYEKMPRYTPAGKKQSEEG